MANPLALNTLTPNPNPNPNPNPDVNPNPNANPHPNPQPNANPKQVNPLALNTEGGLFPEAVYARWPG